MRTSGLKGEMSCEKVSNPSNEVSDILDRLMTSIPNGRKNEARRSTYDLLTPIPAPVLPPRTKTTMIIPKKNKVLKTNNSDQLKRNFASGITLMVRGVFRLPVL